jgi:hypothetical protein
VFDWLHAWLAGAGSRGCAFINSFAELGVVDREVAAAARDHKQAVLRYLTELAENLRVADPAALAGQLLLLVDGAITVAAISGDPGAALRARTAAQSLVTAASAGHGGDRVPKTGSLQEIPCHGGLFRLAERGSMAQPHGRPAKRVCGRPIREHPRRDVQPALPAYSRVAGEGVT